MRGLVRLLIMFGPMIFRQVQKFQRRRPQQVAPPQPRQQQRPVEQQPQNKNQKPVEQEYYEEDIIEEGDFVDPINN